MKQQSNKQARIITKYSKQRKVYLSKPENQLCKINVAGCTRFATEIHHSAKKTTEKLWLDETYWIPSCNNCHRKIEDSPELARELGIYNYKS